MSNKGNTAKPSKPANDPGRNMHPNAAMRNQAATKNNPCVKSSGKGK